MKATESQLETRISRHLDGQLTGQDQADLYRELLRDPKARQLMDDYAANDKLVTDALRAALGSAPATIEVDQLPDPTPRALPWRQVFAAAAVITLMALGWIVGQDTIRGWLPNGQDHLASTQPTHDDNNVAADEQPVDVDALLADLPQTDVTPWWRQSPSAVQGEQLVDASVATPVVHHVHNAQLQTDRAVLGVIDPETDTMYWLEMQTDQTTMGSDISEL